MEIKHLFSIFDKNQFMKKGSIFLLIVLFSNFSFTQSLMRIIDKGDSEKFKIYIDKGENLDEYILFEGGKHTYNNEDLLIHPMVYAAELGQFEIVKLCVKNKDKIEDFHNIMSKAFVASLDSGNDDLISYLFNLNPNVNEFCGTCYSRNAIMITAVNGLDKWYFKIKPNADLNQIDEVGYTLLHLAVLSSNTAIINDVLSMPNINLNAKDSFHKTALNLAVIDSSESTYFTLLKKGSQILDTNDFFSDITIGGNSIIFNDFIKKIPNPNLWQNHKYMDYTDEEATYPLENAILSNNNTISFWILDQMISELKTNKSEEKIKILYSILNGYDYAGLKDYISVTTAIENNNKPLFEKLLKTALWFNEQKFSALYVDEFEYDEFEYDVDLEVYFSKFDYKDAKKMFGKEYVELFYEDLGIEF